MTSDLGPSKTITKFVRGGQKNYAYRVLNTVTGTVEKTVCVVRGITLNYYASRMVNCEVIIHIILRGTGDEHTAVNVQTKTKIKRKKKGGIISISPNPKINYTEIHSSIGAD